MMFYGAGLPFEEYEEPYFDESDESDDNDNGHSIDDYVDEYGTSHPRLGPQQQSAEEERKERNIFQNAQQNLLSHVCVSVYEVSRAIGTMYDDQRYSDVTLVVGDRRFHAHRLVLSAWSDVFKTMLCNSYWQPQDDKRGTDTTEQPTSKCQDLVEEECCEEFFGDFLKFLYTASVDLTKANVLPLVLLADKYLVKELRELCDEFIRDNQNDAQEVVTFIHLASQFGMRDTVEMCLQSLLCNFSVLTPDQLLSLESEHLISLLDSGPRLMVDDEFTLFKKIEPWLDQCQSGDTLLSIIKLIRFPYMNALQLKEARETTAIRRAQEMMPDILLKSWQQQALYKEGSLEDLPEDFPWPRLYLNSNDEDRLTDQKVCSCRARDQPKNEPIEVDIDMERSHRQCVSWKGKRIGQKHFFKKASTVGLYIKPTQSPDSPSEVIVQIETYEDSQKRLHLGVRAQVEDGKKPFYFSKCLPPAPQIVPNQQKTTSRDTQFTFPTGISDPEIMTFHVAVILEDEDEKTTDHACGQAFPFVREDMQGCGNTMTTTNQNGRLLSLSEFADIFRMQAHVERIGDEEPVENQAQHIEEARRLKQAGLPHLDVPNIEPEFGRFFNDLTYSDITLLVGTHSFHAHRLILSSWSSVFKDILKTSEEDLAAGGHAEDPGMRTYRLDEDPDCSEVFDTFLKFLYTNEVTFTEENFMPLLQLSNKFKIDELNKLCDSYIGDLKIDVSSAISVLIQAMKYKMAHTIASCINVLRPNFGLLTAEQLQVLDSSLIIALLDYSDQSLVVKDEFTLLQKLIPWLANCTDEETFKTVVGYIRFPFMSTLQLKAVMSSVIMRRLEEVIPTFIVDALEQHSIYREAFTGEILQSVPLPRLYLNPPVALFGQSEVATTGNVCDEEGFMELKIVESTQNLLQNVLVNSKTECTANHYKVDDYKEWFIDVKRIDQTVKDGDESYVLCGLKIGILRKHKHDLHFYRGMGARVPRVEESYRRDQIVEVAVQVNYEDGSNYVLASRRPLSSIYQDRERDGKTDDEPLFTFETPCTMRSLTAKVKVRVSVVVHRSPESQSKDK